MSYAMDNLRGDDALPREEAEDVIDQLSRATDVLELLSTADTLTPSAIDMWGALILRDEPLLHIHAPRPLSPALVLAMAESMAEELAACADMPRVQPVADSARMSCVDVQGEVITGLSDAFHDHVTQRREEMVAIARASAVSSRDLTLDRWRQADHTLEVIAWMLGALTDGARIIPGLTDPITGLYSRTFFEECLGNELARHQRQASELSVVLLQLRRSNAMLADEPPSPAVLANAGAVMNGELREADILARLDARRLAALLPCTSPRDGLIAASRLGEALQDTEALKGWSMDIGVSGLGMDVVAADELLDQATHAMLSAQKGSTGFPFVYV